MRTNSLRITFLSALAFAGCDSGTPADAGTDASSLVDAGGNRDAGRTDAGRRDAGPTDSCANEDATMTVGCNGGLLGADRDANEFGGICTADDTTAEGTCTGTAAVCAGTPGQMGICLQICTPGGDEYVTTGDCPTGSRCFNFGDYALCYPDCESGADCATNNCDGEGSCVDPDPVPVDAGMTDAGMTDAGMTDAGMTDAGPFDAGPGVVPATK